MVKLLIVEDEKEIREGLAAWGWEAVGIEVAGTCAHGLERGEIAWYRIRENTYVLSATK